MGLLPSNMIMDDIIKLCDKMYNRLSDAGLVDSKLKLEYKYVMESHKGSLLNTLDNVLKHEAAETTKDEE